MKPISEVRIQNHHDLMGTAQLGRNGKGVKRQKSVKQLCDDRNLRIRKIQSTIIFEVKS